MSVFAEVVTAEAAVSIIEAVAVSTIEAAVSTIEAHSSKLQLSPTGCHLIQYLCITVIFRALISIDITCVLILKKTFSSP